MNDERDRQEQKHQKRLRAMESQRKLRIDDFVKSALTTVYGREYIYWLLELGHIGRNPFSGNALTTAFSCGELNVGQQIQAHLIEVSPDGYLNMLKEKEEERINGRSSSNSSTNTSDSDSGGDSSGDSAEPN